MRVTPAYAGNTIAPTHVRRSSQEHPRVCGEHDEADIIITNPPGASPRMRGAHYQKRQKYATSTLGNGRKTSIQPLFTYQTT